MGLLALVINRAGDTGRLARISESAEAHGVPFERVAALDAHHPDFPFALYDDLIGPHFWGKPDIKPGAIGCYLSHRRAWQRILDLGLTAAVICEDDAVFSEDLSRLEALPEDLDIVFANSRMASWAAVTSDSDRLSLQETMKGLAAKGGPKAHGLKISPGADCYLLTRRGAERMIALSTEQKIICGVDWAMLWNGLDAVDETMTEAFRTLGTLKETLPEGTPSLNIAVLTRPVAGQVDHTPSTLRHSVTRPIAELVGRGADLAHTEYVATVRLGDVALGFAGRSGPDPIMESHREGKLWDEPGLRALLARFPEGGTFVDIGAHLGNHAVAMARLGLAGRMIMVEPNEEIVKLLRANLVMNTALGRSQIIEPGVACWASEGDGWLLRNRRRSSETMVKAEVGDDQKDKAEPLKLVTADSLLADQAVDAIKIDTSGSEPDVLRGLTETLKTQRPVVLIDHAEQGLERIARLADERGYDVAETLPCSRQNRATSLLVPRPDDGQ